MPFRAVSAADLEQELEKLRQATPNPALGLFGPGSANWKINRESALFLAAGRAALLQLAHPWIAAAIAQHSRTLDDPIRRFRHTFRVMFTMSFGSLDQAFEAARRLHRLHESIRGTVSETAGRFKRGSNYQANEVDSLVWVFAALIDSSLLAYELVLPALSPTERDKYYAESRKSAALFGIPADRMPQNLAAFQQYMQSALHSDMLGVSAATRELAHRLQSGAGLWIHPPFWYRALTTQLLPLRFRQEFGFIFGEHERNAADRAIHWIRRTYIHMPSALRFVGPYNEIQSRLAGRVAPGLAVRISNRMWIGQPSLFT